MNSRRKLQLRLRALFQKRKLDAAMDEEMRSHIEMQTQENIDAGMDPEQARYAALRQFGWVETIKETCREQRGVSWIEHLIQDFRYGLRMLRKNPGSSVLALLILALGIGETTAVFSVADKVLLNPIPGRNSKQMITVHELEVMHDARWNVAPPLFEQLSSHTNLFESLTYFHQGSEEKKIRVGDKTLKLKGAQIAPNFFALLGIAPSLGRTFLPGEGGEASDSVIVISHGLWQQYLGGVRDPIGKSIELDGTAFTVVGVMPPNVQFPFGPGESQFWVPHIFTSEELHSEWASKNRFWSVIGRLQEGVTMTELQAVIDAIAARRQQEISEPNQRWAVQAEPARRMFAGASLEKTLWTLQATIAVLLVITCANVGNLLLSRANSRRAEFGIRMAVGAGRSRVARQLLTESLTLAGLAVALGVFVSWGGIKALEQFYLSDLRRLTVIGMDWRVLITACLMSAGAGVLFGTGPAWLAARTNVNQSLKESAQVHGGGLVQRMLQDGLVVIQTSLAVVLLVGAALMIQSTVRLLRVDPGLDPKGLYVVQYDPNPVWEITRPDFESAERRGLSRKEAIHEWWPEHVRRQRQWNELMVERLRSVPGIEMAAINGNSMGSYAWADYQVEGTHDLVKLNPSAIGIRSGDYFRTLKLPLIAGRLLNEQDCIPGQQAVVVNQELARRCWPGQSPLGKRLSYAGNEEVLKEQYVVVGVVKDMMDWKKDVPQQPTFYLPMERNTKISRVGGNIMFRSNLDPDVLRDLVIRLGREMLPSVELNGLFSIEAELSRSTAPRRVMMWLLISLGGLGLLLSALGVYAVLAYAVARRTREVGVRMAMGAGRSQIRGLFLRHGVRLVANGLVLGIAAAITAGIYMDSLLYGVKPTDPWAFLAVGTLLAAVALFACWLPARRAAKVDPMVALRYE